MTPVFARINSYTALRDDRATELHPLTAAICSNNSTVDTDTGKQFYISDSNSIPLVTFHPAHFWLPATIPSLPASQSSPSSRSGKTRAQHAKRTRLQPRAGAAQG